MTDWVTITLIVDADEVDLVAGLVWDLGVAGLEELGDDDGTVELRIGCESTVVPQVTEALADRWSLRVAEVSATEGLDAWRSHAEVWRVGPFAIVPPWVEIPSDVDEQVLFIDPGHAFGSASHPTTRLCLAAIAEVVAPGTRVADIGCGSGILAVAAARCGAESIAATDIAPEAILATIANAERNGVLHHIEISDASVDELESGSFDVVIANIGAATLCDMAEDLVRCCADSGTIVLSGILDVQIDTVVETFTRFSDRTVEVRAADEWRAVILRGS